MNILTVVSLVLVRKQQMNMVITFQESSYARDFAQFQENAKAKIVRWENVFPPNSVQVSEINVDRNDVRVWVSVCVCV